MERSNRLWLYGIALLLTSCASLTGTKRPADPTPTPATELSKVCAAWKPIFFSRQHDTVETIEQAKQNNAAREVLCGKP